ncbi:hypothetical protein BJ165DRAFT_1512286 [Panaeolus papilionaceus]|nr:hypothetical protein BJ165DRAFT_1512187 [Panaeolus papilionaceus]KAF9034937.1 hypothetical protein BJ165DRAFT_1512286 [Panaeolus papilionaceus]
MAHRLEFDNKTPSPNEISSRRGLRLFMQYCFIPMKRGQYNVAEEILRYIIVSNAYQPQDWRSAICIVLITCSILAERPDVVVEQARKLIAQQRDSQDFSRIPRERAQAHRQLYHVDMAEVFV